MAVLVKEMGWNYVATISEEGNMGGIDAFVTIAKNESITNNGFFLLVVSKIII